MTLTIIYMNIISDQPPLIEGDIIDDDDTRRKIELERTGGAAYDALNGGKWPNGVVPYRFGSVGKWFDAMYYLANVNIKKYHILLHIEYSLSYML